MLDFHSLPRREHRKKSLLRKHVLLSTRKATVLSAAIISVAAWYSIHVSDWQWFARSGSLIVVIGIILTSTQVIENSRRLRLRRNHHGKNFSRDFADDIKLQVLERSRGLDENIRENGLYGLYLLVPGTLIWGFGDLAGRLYALIFQAEALIK